MPKLSRTFTLFTLCDVMIIYSELERLGMYISSTKMVHLTINIMKVTGTLQTLLNMSNETIGTYLFSQVTKRK